MLLYVKANGQKLPGLVRRRQAEVNLYKHGTYSSSGGSSSGSSSSGTA